MQQVPIRIERQGNLAVYPMGGENLEVEIAEFLRLAKRVLRHGDTVETYNVSDAKPFGALKA